MVRVQCPLPGCKRFHELKQAKNRRGYIGCDRWNLNVYFRTDLGLAWVRSHREEAAPQTQTGRTGAPDDEEDDLEFE